jgi:1-acyl-sn-glycerol-3-phosphate acyltransferase
MRQYLGLVPRALWKILFILNFIVGLLLLYPVFRILLANPKRYPRAFRLMRVWARWVLIIPSVRVKVKHETPIEQLPTPCIFVANHASYIDIVASYVVMPHYFAYMGKAEIDKAPALRIFFRPVRKGNSPMNIYVDRRSRMGSYDAFRQAAQLLQDDKSVFIYPEGTISSKGVLKSFKNGAFKLAIEHNVPVVPITFHNNWKLLQNGGFFKAFGRPGTAYVTVHAPIETKHLGEKDLVTLRDNVRNTIQQALQQYEN